MVENVCDAVRVAPLASGLPYCPGWQSTKYSPISDCGRDWQDASERNVPKPLVLTCTVTTASRGFEQCAALSLKHRSIDVMLPAGTPATLNWAPLTRPKALSNSSR